MLNAFPQFTWWSRQFDAMWFDMQYNMIFNSIYSTAQYLLYNMTGAQSMQHFGRENIQTFTITGDILDSPA